MEASESQLLQNLVDGARTRNRWRSRNRGISHRSAARARRQARLCATACIGRQGLGLSLLAATTLALGAGPAAAYVGPGAGLTAIGTVLSLFAAVALAVVGFVWYPIKRLLRRIGRHPRNVDGEIAGRK